jgi:hypothetical protein
VVLQRPPRRATFRAIEAACLVAVAALTIDTRPASALIPQISATGTPPGWSGPVVPRNTGDATDGAALLPTELTITTPTYLNWAVYMNAALWGTWHDELYLDGELIQLVTRSRIATGSNWWLATNTGPLFVPGGRHTLVLSTDPEHQVETDHSWWGDNVSTQRYVWKPAALAAGASAKTAPPVGSLDSPGATSCNAFEFTRTPGTAWIVSLGQGASGCALAVYDDYVNSTTGLSHEIGPSTVAQPANFVVGADAGVAPVLYPAVVRPDGSAEVQVTVAVADAAGRQSANGVGLWPSVNLPAGHTAQVFEAHLTAGYAESAVLTRFMGRSDLELLIYPPGVTGASRDQATWVSTPRDGDDEYDDFAFTPPATGTYLFVVARVDGQFLDDAMGYKFELVANGTVGASPTIAAAPLAAAPSPAVGPMRFSFALAHPARVQLEVFDLAGRAVRRLADESLPAGPQARTWDGHDDRGAAVAPGRYWARLTAGSRRESLSVLRIR